MDSDQEEESDQDSDPGAGPEHEEVPEQEEDPREPAGPPLQHEDPNPEDNILPPPGDDNESRSSAAGPPPWNAEMIGQDALMPRHASTPAHPSSQSGSELDLSASSARSNLDTIPETNEGSRLEPAVSDPLGAQALPPADPAPGAATSSAPPPDVTSDYEIARQVNADDRESHGMGPFPSNHRTRAGRDTKHPERFQAGSPRTPKAPPKK